MSMELKTMIADVLRDRYVGIDEACVVDMSKLSVQDAQSVRRSLTAKNLRVSVVKNSMARRAFEGGPLESLSRGLSGPCALVTGGDSIIDMARALVDIAKEYPNLTTKHAVMDGEAELYEVSVVAKFRGRLELLGEVANLVGAPGRSIAGAIASPQGKIAGCLKAIVENSGD
jgi:large subunit ribosomal protein L10